jgi:hypothetical protein
MRCRRIEYRYRAIYVKDVLTHAEYDKGKVKGMSSARGIVVDDKAYRKLLFK